jgi:tetratricopeptide (TPR) repeat protein
MEVDSMIYLADAQLMGGKPEEGITTARAAHRISLEILNAWGAANSSLILALGLCDRGEYGEALEIACTGVAQARVAGYPPLLVSTLWCLGNMYRLLFALDAAYTAHTEAKAIAETFSHPMFTDMVLAGLCADAAAAGDRQEAYSYVQQALTLRDYEMPYVGYTLWYGTEALLRAGEEERAAQDARRFGEGAGNTKRYRIPYLRSLALLAQYRGEIEQAIGHLQEAATLAEEIGLPGELWSILATLGELSLTLDDGKQNGSAFGQAAMIVRKLAEKIGDDERRANFLSSPSVSRVLEEALPGDGKVLPEVSGES